jgi:hypothetical protein
LSLASHLDCRAATCADSGEKRISVMPVTSPMLGMFYGDETPLVLAGKSAFL